VLSQVAGGQPTRLVGIVLVPEKRSCHPGGRRSHSNRDIPDLTLQELIGPTSVEFFSKEGELLGNKIALERQICEVTSVPTNALQRGSLSSFSINEGILWTATRETTRVENIAYSLLGNINVSISLIYGKGREKVFRRLKEEIEKNSKGRSFTLVIGIVSQY
jgi:hypothetical protein